MNDIVVIDGVSYSGSVTAAKKIDGKKRSYLSHSVKVLRGDGHSAEFEFVRSETDQIGCYLKGNSPEGCDGARMLNLMVNVSGTPDWCDFSHILTPRTDRVWEYPLPQEIDLVESLIVAKFFFDMFEMKRIVEESKSIAKMTSFMFEHVDSKGELSK